jgi:F-type H+-transporting ATPase subunit delta
MENPSSNQARSAVADQYAQAILPLAREAGGEEDILDELGHVETMLREHGQFFQLVESGLLPGPQLQALLERAFRGRVSDLTCNTLLVIARHKRLGRLGTIVQASRQLFERQRGRVPVQVITAVPLDEATRAAVTETIAAMLGREPVLDVRVDGRVLGGLEVRVGDEVYDATVAGELDRLKASLLRRQAGASSEAGR